MSPYISPIWHPASRLLAASVITLHDCVWMSECKRYQPLCGDIGCLAVKTLTVRIWVFCASGAAGQTYRACRCQVIRWRGSARGRITLNSVSAADSTQIPLSLLFLETKAATA
jgi:hypothetical protein